ncbi:zinc-dependent peptidase [Nonlabens mediterrranea]|uniref:Zinc-dependent peptidase n=1 Tax=Nonlabens mediterrranea TaxID=1419947 RepID=A0ABS0A4X3_9FLAO|nr:zinc-dependent peptidase [Nonlabens mediterrranea]
MPIFNLFRKKTPAPSTDHWDDILLKYVSFFGKLEARDRLFFKLRMQAFLDEIEIETIETEPTETDALLIAASAIIPVFQFPDWHYSNLKTVILLPEHFNTDLEFEGHGNGRRIFGMVGTGKWNHKMILSKEALYHGFKNDTDKLNTAIHEFVHLIDKMDGTIDGIPHVLLEQSYVLPWINLMHEEMERINKDKSDIRQYGGSSQIEFFAVAAEYFFSRPKLMKRKHPDIYQMLSKCFTPDEE